MTARPFALAALLAATLAAPAGADRLVFLNGDRIPGSLEGLEAGAQLLWQLPGQGSALRLPLASIHKLQFTATDDPTAADHDLAVDLTNGDAVHGRLLELTPEAIEMESAAFGKLRVPRPMINGLNVTEGGYCLLANPGKGQDWSAERRGSWRVENGQMVARDQGWICRALLPADKPAPERIRIDFDCTTEESGAGITLHFFCADEKNPTGDTNYTVQISGSYVFARKSVTTKEGGNGLFGVKRINRQNEQLGEPQRIERSLGPGGTKVTLLADARAGLIILKLNGAKVKQWVDPRGLGGKHGSAIGFTNNGQGTTTIRNLSVLVWSGLVEDAVPSPASRKDQVFLRNDDSFEGRVVSLADHALTLQADHFGPIVVPTDRILRVQLGSDSTDQARRMAGDVRAAFRSGGQLTLQMRSLDKEGLSGFSENSGDARLALKSLREIEFNLYAEKYPSPEVVTTGGLEALLEGGW